MAGLVWLVDPLCESDWSISSVILPDDWDLSGDAREKDVDGGIMQKVGEVTMLDARAVEE